MKTNKLRLISMAALAAIPAYASAAVIVDVDFENSPNHLENLVDFSSTHNPGGFPNSLGVDGSNGLFFDGNTWAANDTALAISPELSFSVDGRYSGSGRDNGAGLTFGWTQAAGPNADTFNTTTNETVTVGITNASGPTEVPRGTYVLSAAGGIGSHGSTGFSDAVQLTLDNWYRLSGTILFDGSTNTFTFNDIRLFDLGANGTSTPNQLLFGTGETLTNANWDGATTGRVSVLANKDRGFKYTDNVFAEAIPEPSAALLGAIGSLLLLRRRRI